MYLAMYCGSFDVYTLINDAIIVYWPKICTLLWGKLLFLI